MRSMQRIARIAESEAVEFGRLFESGWAFVVAEEGVFAADMLFVLVATHILPKVCEREMARVGY
jgi:hypothetical protein